MFIFGFRCREFDKWKRRDDGCVEESEELKSESPVSQSQLQSQAGFLDILHKRLCGPGVWQ